MDCLYGNALFEYERREIEQQKNNKLVIDYIGRCYIGQIDQKGFAGYGLLQDLEGYKYEGLFEKGVLKGYGIMYCPDGRRYEGELKEGKMDGKGQLIYKKIVNKGDCIIYGEIVNKGDFIMGYRQIEPENSISDYDDVEYFQVIIIPNDFINIFRYTLNGDHSGLNQLYLVQGDENPIAQNDIFGIIKFISNLKYDNIAVKIVTHGNKKGNNSGIELNDILRIIENLNNQTGKLIVIFASCCGGGFFQTLQSDDCLSKVSNIMKNKPKLHTFSMKVAKEENLCYNVFLPNKNVITSQYNLSTEDVQGKPPGIYDLDEVKFTKEEYGVERRICKGSLLTKFNVKQTQRPTRHVTEPIRKLQQQLEHPSDNRRPISQILGSFRDQQLQLQR